MQYHLRQVGEIADPSGGERSIGQLQVSVGEYRALATQLLAAFRTTVDRVVWYLGWDSAKFTEAVDRAALDLSH